MPFESNSIFWVEVDKISPNPFQPRRDFDESRLRELADSIRMYGIMQPLTVTRREIPKEDGGLTTSYELIAGERRLRASKLAGLPQVPVIIRSSEESDRMKLELAIIENLQREDLNPVDRALAFKQLAEQFELSHSQVARKVGRSREYVSNTLRLLALPEDIISSMKRGEITEGHGRALLMLSTRPEEQKTLFREIILKRLSVREVERISRRIATERVRKKEWNIDPELVEIEKQFTNTLGTRVQISQTDFGGKLTIDYFSQEDLRKILDVIAEGKQHVVDSSFAVPDIPRSMMQQEVVPVVAPAIPLMVPEPRVLGDAQREVVEAPVAPVFEAEAPVHASLRPHVEAMVHAPHTVPTEVTTELAQLSGVSLDAAPQESVAALVREEVGETTLQESVDSPTDDRTHAEQIEVEKKDIAEDPDLYAVKNFSL
ncbi:MAG: chromosome partitioning protein ParB, chromosome partitioning protein ParB family [Candidatus Parcubacteria bacterium]|jgi:ParB family chromosome partitioning protein